ncbi:MAG: hypothetical protein RR350_08680, partial [Oscillibacter sp.]
MTAGVCLQWKKGTPRNIARRAAACRKSLFDTLRQVFETREKFQKLMIENERNPSWVPFVTIFLPV